ncbi:hypothetical protein JTE90_012640 [Oedothorax gibbosus]|uniref:Uncharacterized protein n=1 Tax=Oedothorax gibbosus TaxID=931172 RepID=A0AAV6UK13_9ARAC|nr:hypothetical protein JTE90_012640 [Oedothorax gibbosus]
MASCILSILYTLHLVYSPSCILSIFLPGLRPSNLDLVLIHQKFNCLPLLFLCWIYKRWLHHRRPISCSDIPILLRNFCRKPGDVCRRTRNTELSRLSTRPLFLIWGRRKVI